METSRLPVRGPGKTFAARAEEVGAGFSQVDLITLVGVLVLLVMLLTPALAHTRVTDQAFQCHNNLRQLLHAWRMYAEDNNGILTPNPNGGDNFRPSWVRDWEDWSANNPDNTNRLLLANALLGPYCGKQTGIYKCPADVYTCREWGQQMPRVRSVSMNGFVEGDAYKGQKSNPQGSLSYPSYRGYMKLSDIIRPVPSDLLVFLDEHPDSINDGWMITAVDSPNKWMDLPASAHNNGCGVAFADGHSETHKWREGSTAQPILRIQWNGFSTPGSKDIQWMFQHVSAPLP
jgi:prepilin-type processing-associated H-X9-DG protein